MMVPVIVPKRVLHMFKLIDVLVQIENKENLLQPTSCYLLL